MPESELPPRVRAVISQVAAYYGVPVELLHRKYLKLGPIADARHQAMRAVRALTFADGRPPSYPRIGRWFGVHHTTVMHHCREEARQFDLFPPQNDASSPQGKAIGPFDARGGRRTLAA